MHDSSDSSDSSDSFDSFDRLDKEINGNSLLNSKDDNTDDNIDALFANLRKNISIENTQNHAKFTRVNMNWNIIL